MEKRIVIIQTAGANARGIVSPVTIEVEVSKGVGIHVVGLPDESVKEMLLRTVTAIQSAGYTIPAKKIVINFSPSTVHRQGSNYDLPVAIGILQATEQIKVADDKLSRCVFSGELGLDGTIREGFPAYWGYAIAMSTFSLIGQRPFCLVTSRETAMQASPIANVLSYGFNRIHEVICVLDQGLKGKPYLIWEGQEWHDVEKGVEIVRNQSEYPL